MLNFYDKLYAQIYLYKDVYEVVLNFDGYFIKPFQENLNFDSYEYKNLTYDYGMKKNNSWASCKMRYISGRYNF